MKTYTIDEIESCKVLTCSTFVFDKSKYENSVDAIFNNDIMENNVTLDSMDCYHVFDYAASVYDLLQKINKNLIFEWNYFGFNVQDLLSLSINESTYNSERNLEPFDLLNNAICHVLESVKSKIKTKGGDIDINEFKKIKDYKELMIMELMGEVSIVGLSIREWVRILEKEKDDLIKYVIMNKVAQFE